MDLDWPWSWRGCEPVSAEHCFDAPACQRLVMAAVQQTSAVLVVERERETVDAVVLERHLLFSMVAVQVEVLSLNCHQ